MSTPSPLALEEFYSFAPHDQRSLSGRQTRCFAMLVTMRCVVEGGGRAYALTRVAESAAPAEFPGHATFGELREAFFAREDARRALSAIPLRRGASPDKLITAIPQDYKPTITSTQVDPALHVALHDLSLTIIEDIREAAPALYDPGHWYPGVDEGIEPVPDEHVDLVIWALQRELDRERRSRPGTVDANVEAYYGWMGIPGSPLPPLPLANLPRRVQRALVERRRLRYQQWGIGRTEWATGYWSLFNVPEDPDFLPPPKPEG